MSLTTPSPDVEGVHALDNSEHPKSRETECDRSQDSSASKQAKSPDISLTSNLKREPSKTAENHHGSTRTLPIEKVFPIQVGSEVFRLSGASISSDAPSYFSQFFEEQMREHGEETQIRTLYIDRDPLTFRDICRHLQGYHIKPQDGAHFVRLYADAQFYSLPRLISQLFDSEIFIQIGDRHFQIPRDIFSHPGDSPNFFSLGFAVFFSTPGEAFPGLNRKGLLRPPTIVPPSVPNRSADVFAQLLHLLRGYPIHIRDEEHRQELLRDCRYFHLRGLEQKLIACEISYNYQRQRSEILIRIEDIKPSGISLITDRAQPSGTAYGGFVHYTRPFLDETRYELVLEIGGEATIIDLQSMNAKFYGTTKARISSLTQVLASTLNAQGSVQMNMTTPSGSTAGSGTVLSGDGMVKISLDETADIRLDDEPFEREKLVLSSAEEPASNTEEHSTSEDGVTSATTKTSTTSLVQPSVASSGPSSHRQPITLMVGKRSASPSSRESSSFKRPKQMRDVGQWIVRRGQWRLRIQHGASTADKGWELILVAVKLEAFTSERSRNRNRGFIQ